MIVMPGSTVRTDVSALQDRRHSVVPQVHRAPSDLIKEAA
jgi:hypothetical protein